MSLEDVRQVSEIDREAFPTMLPPADFQRELENKLARYMVICDSEKTADPPEVKVKPDGRFIKVASRVMRFLNSSFWAKEMPPGGTEYVVGFVGMWILVDEAHVTSIAVRQAYQRRGLGEWLLIAAIEMAMELKAHLLTLEVRVSNITAQNLYSKYGFTKVGVRRGYYSDNSEDGLLMSTEDIGSPAFQERFQQLKAANDKRWQIPREVSR